MAVDVPATDYIQCKLISNESYYNHAVQRGTSAALSNMIAAQYFHWTALLKGNGSGLYHSLSHPRPPTPPRDPAAGENHYQHAFGQEQPQSDERQEA